MKYIFGSGEVDVKTTVENVHRRSHMTYSKWLSYCLFKLFSIGLAFFFFSLSVSNNRNPSAHERYVARFRYLSHFTIPIILINGTQNLQFIFILDHKNHFVSSKCRNDNKRVYCAHTHTHKHIYTSFQHTATFSLISQTYTDILHIYMFKWKLWIFAQSVYSFDVANDDDLFAFNVVDVTQTFCLLATRSHTQQKRTSLFNTGIIQTQKPRCDSVLYRDRDMTWYETQFDCIFI